MKGLEGLPAHLLQKVQKKESEKNILAMMEPTEKKKERWALQRMEKVKSIASTSPTGVLSTLFHCSSCPR